MIGWVFLSQEQAISLENDEPLGTYSAQYRKLLLRIGHALIIKAAIGFAPPKARSKIRSVSNFDVVGNSFQAVALLLVSE
jgi:hypothetical protein